MLYEAPSRSNGDKMILPTFPPNPSTASNKPTYLTSAFSNDLIVNLQNYFWIITFPPLKFSSSWEGFYTTINNHLSTLRWSSGTQGGGSLCSETKTQFVDYLKLFMLLKPSLLVLETWFDG